MAAGAFLGCARESSGPVRSTAGSPAPRAGQTEAQAESQATGAIELPPGTSLREDLAAARGTDRVYETDLTYEHAVGYFDHAPPKAQCEKTSRTSTDVATFWSLRCPDGETAYLAVRNALPTTIEILAGSE
jgi:hypothetical protein